MDAQKKQILAWIPEQEIVSEDNAELSIDGTWIRDFLGIRDNYRSFPHWILGKKPMEQAALLAVLRNVACHGSLLPSKAKSWGLEVVYEEGIHVVGEGFGLLLRKLVPT
jgi:hypothetical protein